MVSVAQSIHGEKLFLDTRTLFQVVGASFFMAFCSQIQFVLPFTLVPITFQTLAVLLIGATLGSKKGALAILLYYSEILMGLPVLAGGLSNPLIFLGPKGGYVLGFYFQAWIMGWCVEKNVLFRSMRIFLGGLLACAVQMSLGICILAQFVGWQHVWAMGLFPFIPGEILKVMTVVFGFTCVNSYKLQRMNF